jgi:uncharacterized protein (DUF1778 family)
MRQMNKLSWFDCYEYESAEKEAEIAVEEGVVMRFTAEQHDQLIDALLNPPEPNNVLKKASQRYDRADITSR